MPKVRIALHTEYVCMGTKFRERSGRKFDNRAEFIYRTQPLIIKDDVVNLCESGTRQ